MKRIALALIACAGLGFIAGRQPVLPSDSRRSEPVRPVLNSEAGPVETPLVEKLLVPTVKDSLPVAPTVKESLTIQDGQLSPGGNFRYEAARDIWVPVDKGNRQYRLSDGSFVTAEHLIEEHNHHPDCANQWTRAELEIAHANDHAGEARVTSVPQEIVYSKDCPGGNCGNTKMGRGLLRRRR